MRVGVVTDSTASLSPLDAEREHIAVVPVVTFVGSAVYTQDVAGSGFGASSHGVTGSEIAKAMRDGVLVSTSRPSPETFAGVYAKLVADGVDAICSVHLSGAVSGTVHSAQLAAESCSVPVEVVDTRQVSLAVGHAAGVAARVARLGASLGEVAQAARNAAAAASIFIYVDSLEYLRRGGRIGAAASLVGSVLAVKPILTMRDGEVCVVDRVRTRARALDRLLDLSASAAEQLGEEFDIGVQHLDQEVEADELASKLASRLGTFGIAVDELGADLGAHAGPGTIAVTVTGR